MANLHKNLHKKSKGTYTLRYGVIPKNDYVLVVGAGPSTKICINKICNFIKEKKPLIFGANYNYKSLGIYSHFTYITDADKLTENLMLIDTDLIIPFKLRYMLGVLKSRFIRFSELHRTYIFGNVFSKKFDYEKNNDTKLDVLGHVNMDFCGIAGFGAMTASLVAKPKYMVFVGIDDPKVGNNYKISFDGKITPYTKPQKCLKVINYFSNRLVPLIRSHNVELQTFEEVSMLGLSKKELKIKVIK